MKHMFSAMASFYVTFVRFFGGFFYRASKLKAVRA